MPTYVFTDGELIGAGAPATSTALTPTGASDASQLTIAYDPATISFDPLDHTRVVKLGFVSRPQTIRLEIISDPDLEYEECKIWGPHTRAVEWLKLPVGKTPGQFSIQITLNRVATLAGDVGELFALNDGQKLIIATATNSATYAEQTVTFATADFVDINNATAAEVSAIITAQATNVTATAIEGRVVITSKKDDSFLQVASGDGADHTLGFGPDNNTTIYYPMWRGNSSKLSRIYVALRKSDSTTREILYDWIVRDEVVPAMPSDIRKMEWFGVPLFTEDGQIYSDEQIWQDIIDSMGDIEQETRVRLTPLRVVTEVVARNKQLSEPLREHFDYDLDASASDYDIRNARAFFHLQTREYPILSVEEFQFRDWNNKSIADFVNELKIYRESGQLKLVPGVSGSATWKLFQMTTFFGQTASVTWPKWIWLRYTAGPRDGRLRPDAIDAIRKAAWIRVARVISDAIARGAVSSSINDGAVSESRSTAASAQSSLFGGRIKQYEDHLYRWKQQFTDRHKGVTMVML